jgi:hypothetical protein
MNESDILNILVYANELDGRHSPNEVKVMAWRELFDVEAPDMPVTFAKDQITAHYAKTDIMVSPAVIVTAWKQDTRNRREALLSRQGGTETHCGRGGCPCSHSGECVKGWIDSESSTMPCPMCRPSLLDAVSAMPEPGKRNEHHYATLRNRTWADNG